MQSYYSYHNNYNTSRRNTKLNTNSRWIKKKVFRLVVLSALLLCSFIFGSYIDVFANSNESHEKTFIEQSVIVDHQFVIHIERGDRLWTIAKTHAPDHMNIRAYMNLIKNENNLKNNIIYEGQIIKLPQ